MISLLDDPALDVRFALADVLAHSPDAPEAVLIGLVQDVPEIAAIVVERSPLLLDAELVDLVGSGQEILQIAVASRTQLSASVAAALAAVGSHDACVTLLANRGAHLLTSSLDRILERLGDSLAIREAIALFDDLAPSTRQALIMKACDAMMFSQEVPPWMTPEQADRFLREATEQGTVAMAATIGPELMQPLVAHLRQSGQLTAALLLRAILCGNISFFEAALASLSGMPLDKMEGLVRERHGNGFRAVYRKAGLPDSAFKAFVMSIDGWYNETGLLTREGRETPIRSLVDGVVAAYEAQVVSDYDLSLILLRRFASEAARLEARRFTQGLIAEATPATEPELNIMVIEGDRMIEPDQPHNDQSLQTALEHKAA